MDDRKIGVIGLGYVGLPLAVEFGKKLQTIGFDVNVERVNELRNGHDKTLEVTDADLKAAQHITYTYKINDIESCNYYVIAVPTPTDKHHRPDLTPLKKASATVGQVLKPGDIVIYESTVYPGATEDDCVPVLEEVSGLTFNVDFFVGYSPERINPGDKVHTVTKITKVTSGSTPEVADKVDQLYKEIIVAGTHKAASIKVAEASKVIENSQRDINIAFVNELAKICNLLEIDTLDVLEAAGTKWNFLPFRPGLVGGHCIGVDPYYLAQKAQEVGYHPEIILAGRRTNDGMGAYVASEDIKLMNAKGHAIKDSKVLILGITFKENCPDIRNTRVVDVIAELEEFGCHVDVCDPMADANEVQSEYGLDLINDPKDGKKYDAVILAVAHEHFKKLDLNTLRNGKTVVYDVKGVLARDGIEGRL